MNLYIVTYVIVLLTQFHSIAVLSNQADQKTIHTTTTSEVREIEN